MCFFQISLSQNANSLKDSIHEVLYNNPRKAAEFNTELMYLSKLENNTNDIMFSNYLFGLISEVEGDIDSALYYFNTGLKYAEDPTAVFDFNSYMAYVYEKKQNYNKALELYKDCLSFAKTEKLQNKITEATDAIKTIKNKINESIDEIVFLENKYKKERTNDPGFKLVFTRKELAEAYLKKNLTNKALALIDEGIKDASSKKNFEFLYYFNNLLARANIKSKDFGEALTSINLAKDYANKLNNKIFLDEANFILAKLYSQTQKHIQALVLLNSALKSNTHKTTVQKAAYYKLLAENYKAIDSFSQSNYYNEKYILQEKKITENEKLVIGNIYEIFIAEEIKEKEKQAKKKRFWLFAFITSTLVVLVLILWFKRQEKKNNKLFEELLIKTKTLEENKNKSPLINETIHKKSVKDNDIATLDDNDQNSNTLKIDQSKVLQILENLKHLEEQKYFLNKDCNLHNMSKALNTNTSYLSKIINKQLNKSFSTYINDLRINYAVVELKNNKKLRAYSVHAIATELGYKKADSFSKYFKATTGISPSVYIKKISTLTEV